MAGGRFSSVSGSVAGLENPTATPVSAFGKLVVASRVCGAGAHRAVREADLRAMCLRPQSHRLSSTGASVAPYSEIE